ncbi:Outer membrane protein assembly factor BamB, contains PQQ-like beta-propeller repeat [Desulfotomaculum arcticum]|uniref:Outer membrane protein assembly factor BamB, contains PQQ-like beta-propeller repeat n=1 Tax=Desulfotruncus arcticus DSM 17038 TaxID=1121424 RepID=A0A1I2T0X2_9FIRM|nr:PQQ-binding-like beta-propeller repeat protein [Desulfotruncus arcticus]SFG56837.1 Outer membrane protein assembly factor BamB, contains PQQ-like beta-propeller repeat [Desulfotomaculum arcticum] [Desulfotruncus arcticus DSM 17038]
MGNQKRPVFCMLLTLLLLLVLLVPAFAAGISVTPERETYTGGETVTLEADLTPPEGIDWHYLDPRGNRQEIPGDGKSISLTVPVNDSGETVSTVVYAVYEEETRWTGLDIAPLQGSGPLELVALTPPNDPEGPGVPADSKIKMVFNQPVEWNPAKDYASVNHFVVNYDPNYDGWEKTLQKYNDYKKSELLFNEEEPNTVTLQVYDSSGSPLALAENHCFEIKVLKDSIKAQNSEELFPGIYNLPGRGYWRFNTRPAIAVPAHVAINEKRTVKRVTVGETVQMTATVYNDDGSVIPDYPAENLQWETGDPAVATVDEQGRLTGVGPGRVTLWLSVAGAGNIQDQYDLEIRADFPQKLTPQWTYSLDTNYDFGHPVLTADGSLYTLVRAPEWEPNEMVYNILALNGDGTVKEGFSGPAITRSAENKRISLEYGEIDGQPYLFTAGENTLLAVDPETGQVAWQVELDAPVVTPVAPGGEGLLYVGGNDGRVYAMDGRNQAYLWKFDTEGEILNDNDDPMAGQFTLDRDGHVYAVSGRTLWVIDGRQGTLRWKFVSPELGDLITQAAVDYDGTVYIGAKPFRDGDPYRFYALTPPADGGPPAVRWQKAFSWVGNLRPIVDDDGVYVTAQPEGAAFSRFLKLDRENGGVLEDHPYEAGYGIIGEDGYLYTNTAIYDQNRQPVAYYDDYRNALPYLNYTYFSLGPDGTMYRALKNAGWFVDIEAVSLYDLSGSVVSDLRVDNDQVVLYSGETRRVTAEALDQNGVVLSAVALQWSSGNEAVVTVSEDGLLTAGDLGEAEITVRVRDNPAVARTISVQVIEPPVPARMYFVYDNAPDNAPENQQPVAGLTGFVGEGLPQVRVFVEDQHGQFAPKQPVTWSLTDGAVVSMLNYQGGSGDYDIRYNAVLTGKKEGTVEVVATLTDHPDITCRLPVQILAAPYEILWIRPLEGYWWQKRAYHVMGRDDELFFVNENKLVAVEQEDGGLLWEAELGDYLGVQLGKPQVDAAGTIYLYAIDSTAVLAVEPDSGELLWHVIAGTDGIETLAVGEDALYALTERGKLYKLDQEGELLWDSPLAAGANNGLLLSPEGTLYLAKGDTLYTLAGKKLQPFYRGEGQLYPEAITPRGELILQQYQGGEYSLLAVGDTGEENWRYGGLAGRVALSTDADGAVYAVEMTEDADKELYFLYADGGERARATLTDRSRPDMAGVYKPVIGADGVVYLSIAQTNALDPDSGEVLWQAQLKDAYSVQVPDSITVDEDGVVYVTAGEVGLAALRGKVGPGGGLQLRVSGKGSLAPGRCGDLTLDLFNGLEETKDTALTMYLQDLDSGTVLSATTLEDTLPVQEKKTYQWGVRVPVSGKHQVILQVRDRRSDAVLARESIPVGQ